MKTIYSEFEITEKDLDADGHDDDEVSADVLGAAKLYSNLLDRISGEFMVLGFLAFCVWSCNQAERFNTIHYYFGGPDAVQLLHLVEAAPPTP